MAGRPRLVCLQGGLVWVALALQLCFWGLPGASAVDLSGKSRVFLFSVDGMRTDYLHLAKQLNLPTLVSLIDGGVLAKGAYSVFPSVTFPSHTSMITGVYPARHGIWNNNDFGPLDGNSNNHYFYEDIQAKTIFDAAAERGLSVMGVDWPVTVGAPMDPLFPGNDDSPSTLDEAKWLFNSIRGPVHAVIPNATALFGYLSDDKRTAMALEFLDYKQPDLMAFHFNDLDNAEHHNGYMSPEAIKTLQQIDSYMGTILAKIQSLGLLDNATVIVTSDHGFLNTSGTEISPGALLRTMGVIGPTDTLPWQAWTDCSSGVCPIYIHPNAPESVRQTVDEAVEILRSNPAYGINGIWTKEEIPKLGGWPGAYVILSVQTKYQFTGFHKLEGDIVQCCGLKGQHGYNPLLPEMFASFVIKGPMVKVGQAIGMVRLIDVGPTVAYLLGLDLPNVEGRVITEAFVSNV